MARSPLMYLAIVAAAPLVAAAGVPTLSATVTAEVPVQNPPDPPIEKKAIPDTVQTRPIVDPETRSGLEGRLDGLASSIKGLVGDVASLRTEVGNTRREIGGRLDALDGRVETVSQKVDSLAVKVDVQDGRITALEAERKARAAAKQKKSRWHRSWHRQHHATPPHASHAQPTSGAAHHDAAVSAPSQ